MIIGNGIDIIEIIRLQHSIEKYESHFLEHIFTKQEQALAEGKGEMRYAFYAGRWAAKEAIAKALGTGFGLRYDLDFLILRLDMGVGIHAPYDTGKSSYFNIRKFKDALGVHFAVGYPF